MLHQEYLEQLNKYIDSRSDDLSCMINLKYFDKELHIMKNLNFDPVIPNLESLYSPGKLEYARDPVCMLRALILMTALREKSITKWVKKTRHDMFLAVLAGFIPGDTPGIGTYYDFMKRIIDGPAQKHCRCKNRVKRSEYNIGPHKRNLKKEKEAVKEAAKNDFDPMHSRSEKLARKLMAETELPRPPDMYRILEDLLLQLGVIPSIKEGLISDLKDLVLSGDGSILETAASSNGRPSCSCRSEGIYKCEHDRYYTSPTAKWCYNHHHDTFVFGDRYYHLVVTRNGHDFPLLTFLPGGNESDYTLSLTSFDRFLKAVRENGLDITVSAFCGDGHHDAYAHYSYLEEKKVLPIIPLSKSTQKAFPHLLDDSNIRLDEDGTPLCPAGLRMRHHYFNKRKRTHVYCCPAKRNTHRNHKSQYVFHEEDCPNKQECEPRSPLGPYVHLKSSEDRRLFPPLPRDSRKFQDLMNQRTASERCNFVNDSYGVEGACRNADYGLIRLILANIAHHAGVRYEEAKSKADVVIVPFRISEEDVCEEMVEFQDSS